MDEKTYGLIPVQVGKAGCIEIIRDILNKFLNVTLFNYHDLAKLFRIYRVSEERSVYVVIALRYSLYT